MLILNKNFVQVQEKETEDSIPNFHSSFLKEIAFKIRKHFEAYETMNFLGQAYNIVIPICEYKEAYRRRCVNCEFNDEEFANCLFQEEVKRLEYPLHKDKETVLFNILKKYDK